MFKISDKVKMLTCNNDSGIIEKIINTATGKVMYEIKSVQGAWRVRNEEQLRLNNDR